MKRIVPMVSIFAALAAVVACSRGGDKSLRVVLVAKALDSEFWQRMKSGAEAEAAARGVSLAVLAPEREINIDQQVSILEDQILKRVAAIAVAPAVSPKSSSCSTRPSATNASRRADRYAGNGRSG